jgi:hypothetical protein
MPIVLVDMSIHRFSMENLKNKINMSNYNTPCIFGDTKTKNLCEKINRETLKIHPLFQEDGRWERSRFGSRFVVDSRYCHDQIWQLVSRELEKLVKAENEKLKKLIEKPAKIAEAIYSINKEAKRQRDIGFHAYCDDRYSQATRSKYKKNSLYELKDKAIQKISQNRLTPVGFHEFPDRNRDYYEIEGFGFHVNAQSSWNNLGTINRITADRKRSMPPEKAEKILKLFINN